MIEHPKRPSGAHEVQLTELTRHTSTVIKRVREGEIAVITNHHRPVAMILPLADALELDPIDVGDTEGLRELAEGFRELQRRREWVALFKGRWYGPRKPPPLEP